MRNLGPLGLRCGLTLLLLFVPDVSEVHAAITDAEFQMAVNARVQWAFRSVCAGTGQSQRHCKVWKHSPRSESIV